MTKCPQCGYTDVPQNTYRPNVMHVYINEKDVKDQCTVNADDKTLVIKGVTYVRKDLWVDSSAPKVASVPPATTVPTVPVVQTVIPAKAIESVPVAVVETPKPLTLAERLQATP